MTHDLPNLDMRKQKTRRALFDVFMGLVLKRRYDDIQTSEIITQAGVARSTFYEHFSGKDDLLVKSMYGLLSMIAEAATQKGHEQKLQFVLEHFWENRSFARVIFKGRPYQLINKQLAELIESSLDSKGNSAMHAIGIAAGIMGMIRAWLLGEVTATLDEMTGLLSHKA